MVWRKAVLLLMLNGVRDVIFAVQLVHKMLLNLLKL